MAYDDDFFEVAQETFGLDDNEARELYDDLANALDTDEITVLDLFDYGDMASDLVGERDDEFYGEPDEDWYEPGEEIEISFELKYETVPS